jgi:hypothetical protein
MIKSTNGGLALMVRKDASFETEVKEKRTRKDRILKSLFKQEESSIPF